MPYIILIPTHGLGKFISHLGVRHYITKTQLGGAKILFTTDLGSGMRVHSSMHSHFYGFWSIGIGVLTADGGHELAPV
jgi:hypothetical protein